MSEKGGEGVKLRCWRVQVLSFHFHCVQEYRTIHCIIVQPHIGMTSRGTFRKGNLMSNSFTLSFFM